MSRVNKPKRARSPGGIITINVKLIKAHVIVGHGVSLKACFDYCNKHGCDIGPGWLKEVESLSCSANGLCARLGDGNRDVLVWVKGALNRTSRLSEYGVLTHELFHAVQHLLKDMAAEDEHEFGAYLYEFLFKETCDVLWERA